MIKSVAKTSKRNASQPWKTGRFASNALRVLSAAMSHSND